MKISKEQLAAELKECGISLTDSREYVRWNHSRLGIVFDTIQDYRKQCGYADKIEDLDFVVPAKDAF